MLGELKGFEVPDFIQRKIRAYMTLMRVKHITIQPNELNEVNNFMKTVLYFKSYLENLTSQLVYISKLM